MSETMQRIAELGVVPVIAIESVEAARPMADALIAGGLPIAEITFRTDAAADVIKALKESHPDLLLGAGTVLTVENIERAAACGATFAVAMQIAETAPEGTVILCMLPDTGERYLSSPLFEAVPDYMTEEEVALSHSTPGCQMPAAS